MKLPYLAGAISDSLFDPNAYRVGVIVQIDTRFGYQVRLAHLLLGVTKTLDSWRLGEQPIALREILHFICVVKLGSHIPIYTGMYMCVTEWCSTCM